MKNLFLIILFLFYLPAFSDSEGEVFSVSEELDRMAYYFNESGLYKPEAFKELQDVLHSVLVKKNVSIKSFHKLVVDIFKNKKLSEPERLELMKVFHEIQNDPEAQKALRKQPFYWTFGITSVAMVFFALVIPAIKGNPLDPTLFAIQTSLFLSSMSLYCFNVFRESSAVKKVLHKATQNLSNKQITSSPTGNSL